jgi:hypothetical protein
MAIVLERAEAAAGVRLRDPVIPEIGPAQRPNSQAPLAPTFFLRSSRPKRSTALWPRPTQPSGRHARPSMPEPSVVAFVVVCVGVSAYRFAELYAHGQPTGGDFGNWLGIGHTLLGNGLSNGSHTLYPPLVPLLAVGAVQAFGLLLGWALLAAFCCAVPGLAIFWVLRCRGAGWVATGCGALLLCTSSTAEAAAWGGFPQLLGLGSGVLFVAAFDDLVAHPTRRSGWVTGGWLLALAASSHLILAQVFLVAVVLLIIHLAHSTARQRSRLVLQLLRQIPRVVAPAIPLVPIYLWLLTSVGATFVGSSSASLFGEPTALLGNLWIIYRDNPILWKVLLVVAALAPLLPWKPRRTPLWRLSTALVIGVVIEMLASSQQRFVYLVPVAAAVALGRLAEMLKGLQPVLQVGALALGGIWLGVLMVAGLTLFPAQIAYYGSFVRSGTVSALDWIRANTPPNSLMLVAPINGEPFGWWVEGYARRASLVASADEWLNVPQERERALEAVRLLTASDVLSPACLKADRRAGVDWLVLPTAWGGVTRAQLTTFRRGYPHTTVFHNRAMIVVEVPR